MPRLWTCVALGAYLLARASAQVLDDVVTSADYYYDYDEVDEPPERARAPTPSPASPPATPPTPNPPSPPAGPHPPVVTPPEPPSPPATLDRARRRAASRDPDPNPSTHDRARPSPSSTSRGSLRGRRDVRPGDRLIGRSTYFDAPVAWKAKFEPHLFGDVHGNGCGSFTNKGPGFESNSTTPASDAVGLSRTSIRGSTRARAARATSWGASRARS